MVVRVGGCTADHRAIIVIGAADPRAGYGFAECSVDYVCRQQMIADELAVRWRFTAKQ
jgi:hypothetical protein